MSQKPKDTRGQILKSSAVIGGSTAITVALKFLRNKVVALLLGPSGIGLLGLYQSIADLTRAAVGLGVSSSGVRQIAEAVGTNDSSRVAATITTLRRLSLALGIIGAALLVGFSGPVARFTFGAPEHRFSVILLSVAVLLTCVSDSQAAVLQGLRRIKSLALVNILGAAFGALLGVPLIYFWGERAVAPSIVVAALCSIFASWWMVRRIKFDRFSSRWADLWTEAGALAKLGVVLLSTTLMATGVAYLIRSLVSRHLGVDAAGQYQAAWSVAGQYVNFILQAMAVDFYPRLTAVEKQRDVCNRLVNEQAEVGILLAGPGILATLTFAPFVIQLLFSDKFGPAMELLRWNCLGMLFRVAAWPMGYLMLARNERKLYFSTAFLVHAANLALVWLLVPKWGLLATGVAVFASGVLDFALMVAVAVRINGFRFSGVNAKLGLLFAPLAAALFVGWYFLPHAIVLACGAAATLLSAVASCRMLTAFVSLQRLPAALRKTLLFLRLAPPFPRPLPK